jgi:hypothetical protein
MGADNRQDTQKPYTILFIINYVLNKCFFGRLINLSLFFEPKFLKSSREHMTHINVSN